MPSAMNGDSTPGIITLETSPCHFTACDPAAAKDAPMTPPIRACDELEGIPKYQVSRFQVMPPQSPANTTVRLRAPELTSPLAIVAATLNDRKAPTMLRAAERKTAIRGERAPVAIEVAMALPVSWNPLVKSNAKAVMTTKARVSPMFTALSISWHLWHLWHCLAPMAAVLRVDHRSSLWVHHPDR